MAGVAGKAPYVKSRVWLVFHKAHTGVKSIPYGDTVREALCFGWIDSLIKRLMTTIRPQGHAAAAHEQVVGYQSESVAGT